MAERNYFKINEDKIYLSKKKENINTFYLGTVTIHNITNNYLLFKVYINKQKLYSTNPSTGYILPNEKAEVLVKRQDTNEEVISDEIFMFSAYVSDIPVINVFF